MAAEFALCAWGLFVQAAGIQWGGNISGPPQGAVIIWRNFVDSNYKIDFFMAVSTRCNPISAAINIDEFTVLTDAIQAGKQGFFDDSLMLPKQRKKLG